MGGNVTAPSGLPDPLGLDGTSKGFQCLIDFSDPANDALVGHTAGNTYWTQDGEWGFECGNVTSKSHRWTMEELQAAGEGRSAGSEVHAASELSLNDLEFKALRLLNL